MMKKRFLIWLTKNWAKNKGHNYVQTWYYMPPRWSKKGDIDKIRYHRIGYPARRLLETICGLSGGHELSTTEWGYGGGNMGDRHCRWCDKLIQVPKESIYFQFKEGDPKELMESVGMGEPKE